MSTTLPTGDRGIPEWATAGSDVAIAEPTAGQKANGAQSGERVTPPTFNWLHYLAYLWIAVLDAMVRAARVVIVEDWKFTNTYMEENGWFITSGTLAVAPATPTSAMPRRFLKITGGTNDSCVFGGTLFHYFSLTSEVWMEWEMQVASYGASTDYTIEVGLSFASSDGVHRIVFRTTEALGGTWWAQASDATGDTTYDTGIAATAATTRRFRIEYSGPNGDGTDARCRFYIDGVLVQTITTTTVPKNTAGRLWMKYSNEDVGNAIGDFYVGPIAHSYE